MAYTVSIDQYSYTLPPERIAQAPANPRDSARLFVYQTKTDTVLFDTYTNLAKYLPTDAALVFNNTKVVPARLCVTTQLGKQVETLLMVNEIKPGDTTIKALANKSLHIGDQLTVATYSFTVTDQREQQFVFAPQFPITELATLLTTHGTTPIPKYIKHSPLSENTLRERYQSVFAADPASAAAPTASLHFSQSVMQSLEVAAIPHTFVTLHVGLGTFAPITDTNLQTRSLFAEQYAITDTAASTINTWKETSKTVIAVGTTATRTLESAAINHRVHSGNKETNIFIYPPYEFQIVDGLITNFHVPKSSLMMLVDAFLQHKQAHRSILDLYAIAIKEQFRFYSFGDGMLII